MSNPSCYGGLWPTTGMDAFDIAEAIHDVRTRWSPHTRPAHARTSSEPIRESEVSMWKHANDIVLAFHDARRGAPGLVPDFQRRESGTTSRASAEPTRDVVARLSAVRRGDPSSQGDPHPFTLKFGYFPFQVDLHVNLARLPDGTCFLLTGTRP
jgi:hypothetical protein